MITPTPDVILHRVNNLLTELNKDSVRESGRASLDEFRTADLESILNFVKMLPTARSMAVAYTERDGRPVETLYADPDALGRDVAALAARGINAALYHRDYFVGLEEVRS